jgi:hypothetical protein
MTLDVGSDGYVLADDEGEAQWFSGGLVTDKVTGDQSSGGLAIADVRAPRGTGSPKHRHDPEDEA